MSVNINILFYLKKPKNYLSGPVPVYLRITVDGKRAEVSTSRACEPSRWIGAAGRASGTREAAKSLNSYLDMLKVKVYDAHRQLLAADEPVTAESLKGKLTGKGERDIMLLDVFKEHNEKVAALVGDEFAPGTLERYETSLKHTKDFMEWKYGIGDIAVSKINHAFVADYEFYLRSVRKCSNNTAVKYIKNFGKIIRICMANGWI